MERIRNRIFSVEEANRLIPYLEQALASPGATSRSHDVRELREKEARSARLLEEFRAALHEVASRGCILRDLDLGLVDFYTMARDKVVCLCWRLGEPAIAHWHTTDEGFS